MGLHMRRRTLLVAAAGGAVAATAAVGVAGHEKGATWLTKRWIAEVVRTSLPGTAIDGASLDRFALEAAHAHPVLRTRETHLGLAWRYLLGVPAEGAEQQQLEREIVSWFLTGSNFFSRERQSAEPVVYQGVVPACGNMFARYRDDG